MKSYIANSLFSQADIMFNEYLYDKLSNTFPNINFYLPQHNQEINDKSSYASSLMIKKGDDKYLLESDFLICVIDGNGEIDSGVACEVGKYSGYDMARNEILGTTYRPIFALFTDTRQQGRDNMKKLHALSEDATENQFPYRNLYVVGTIKDSGGTISDSVDKMIESIRKYVSN